MRESVSSPLLLCWRLLMPSHARVLHVSRHSRVVGFLGWGVSSSGWRTHVLQGQREEGEGGHLIVPNTDCAFSLCVVNLPAEDYTCWLLNKVLTSYADLSNGRLETLLSAELDPHQRFLSI